ncbi:hypothetical protein [Niallia taxi]|uniref:hypothetical protein n=1 Tax=Niallia taxi TaxID=2499688 RepID=UPI002E1E4DC0|nr:hypothetical protein [Niallia taxi]
MHKRTFYAAKINVHENIFSLELNEIINTHIPRVIMESKPIKINSWNWSFTDVLQMQNNNENILIGNVTKSKFTSQKVKIGDKTEKRKTDFELAHTAFFVYDPQSEILAHESTGSISAQEFRELFTKLLSRDPMVGDVVINPIPVPQHIRSQLLTIDNITHIGFYLIHPNPGKDEFNSYQDIINDAGLKELVIQMENKDGFNVLSKQASENKPEFISSVENGISLVESGYGTIDVKGYNEVIVQGKRKDRIEKSKKKFSSRKSVRHVILNEIDNLSLVSKLCSFIKLSKNKVNSGDEIGK